MLRCLIGRSSGLDKAKLEVYSVVASLYYGLNVDYALLLWEEFGTSVSHSKIGTGVSSARFWGLILKEIYCQESILVPSNVDTVEFPTMTVPNIVVDDVVIFHVVAPIPDLMQNLVDPKINCWCNIFLISILLQLCSSRNKQKGQ